MLHKSLVSFIAALAAVTSVTASAIPVARNGGGCDTGSLSCCNMITNINDPIVTALEGTAGIALPTDASIPLGIYCVGILSATQCIEDPVCCDNVSQTGLINVGCTPINVGA